jgi:hypothetical protein
MVSAVVSVGCTHPRTTRLAPAHAGAGIPARPNLVTVVPFYTKPNETWNEQTKVVIQATVSGARGVFILDTGDWDLSLNRTFLQANEKGGIDSVTDANRKPDTGPDTVRVTLTVGTITVDLDTARLPGSNSVLGRVVLDHAFGNFSWVFAPRLGNMGVTALEPFETIIDYPHRRVIFIKVDSAGRRLAEVPAYTPVSHVPLVHNRSLSHWGVLARRGGKIDTLEIDTGNFGRDSEASIAKALQAAVAAGSSIFDIDPSYDGGLGYPFLRQLGVVGFNFRAGQLIQYSTL